MKPSARLRIVAPVNRLDELVPLAEAGADEIYCGVLPNEWAETYGDGDSLSRRQGRVANLPDLEQMCRIAHDATAIGLRASLTLNARYTAAQVPTLLEIADAWERAGGHAVIVSSPGLLAALQRTGAGLSRHVSLLANVTNSAAVGFFRRLGAVRIILPRELRLEEMRDLISAAPGIGYEVMALNDNCAFVDGLCGFYHGRAYTDATASDFPYVHEEAGGRAVALGYDLCYAGHGCQIPFVKGNGEKITPRLRDDVHAPSCAACSLKTLHLIGVEYVKIGGRGLPMELKVRAVRFIRDAIRLSVLGLSGEEMRSLYRQTFDRQCVGAACYYRHNGA